MITPIAAIAVVSAFLFFPREQATNEAVVIGGQPPFPELIEETKAVDTEEQKETLPVSIVVDVKGAVHHPGVYSMMEGDRLIDAINAAGGYLPNADSRMINHAMKLVDEFVIYVPVEGEEATNFELPAIGNGQQQQNDDQVNINTADERQLMTLPGIGPSKAAAIIQHRTDHGAFQTTQALMEVSGIGAKTFERLEQYIQVK
ncbi:hypothetical protein AU377_02085 [Sporosarcina sp. HYO08]|nr:hypothetical protein AU377_02085 [Sporosarcina sp. HYO08]